MSDSHFFQVLYHDQIVDENARIEELDSGGGFVHCDSPMPVGTRLTLRLRSQPEPGARPVGPHLVGKVVHVEEASSRTETDLSGMQVNFHEPDAAANEFIEKVRTGVSPKEAAGEAFEDEPAPDAYESPAALVPPVSATEERAPSSEISDEDNKTAEKETTSEESDTEIPVEEEDVEEKPSKEAEKFREGATAVSGQIVSGEIGGGFEVSTIEIEAEAPPPIEIEVEQQALKSRTVRGVPAGPAPEDIETKEKKKKSGKKKKENADKENADKENVDKENVDKNSGDENGEDKESEDENGDKKKSRRGRRNRKKKKK